MVSYNVSHGIYYISHKWLFPISQLFSCTTSCLLIQSLRLLVWNATTNTTTISILTVNLGYRLTPFSFSTCIRSELSGTSGTIFFASRMPFFSSNQQRQSTEETQTASGLASSFLHPPLNSWGSGTAPFMLVLWCRYPSMWNASLQK